MGGGGGVDGDGGVRLRGQGGLEAAGKRASPRRFQAEAAYLNSIEVAGTNNELYCGVQVLERQIYGFLAADCFRIGNHNAFCPGVLRAGDIGGNHVAADFPGRVNGVETVQAVAPAELRPNWRKGVPLYGVVRPASGPGSLRTVHSYNVVRCPVHGSLRESEAYRFPFGRVGPFPAGNQQEGCH